MVPRAWNTILVRDEFDYVDIYEVWKFSSWLSARRFHFALTQYGINWFLRWLSQRRQVAIFDFKEPEFRKNNQESLYNNRIKTNLHSKIFS
jgi:hypothetical protein